MTDKFFNFIVKGKGQERGSKMKIFHTADWHLGKLIHGVYMTEDQRHLFQQFYAYIEEEKPDVVIVAGDLYDRAIPPTEAVELLNEIFEKIVLELETPVIAISGNHDSQHRLAFGSKIMEGKGLHLVGELTYPFPAVTLSDSHGEVCFHLYPYAEPGQVRHILANDDIRTHDDAMRMMIEKTKEKWDNSLRHVAIGHAFVTAAGEREENTSDAERPLSIGGADYVNHTYFQDFHYTALGHLHQAHYVKEETIRYAGSPMKYSISEQRHQKGFYVIDMDGVGNVAIEKRELKPLRDMRTVEGTLEELLTNEKSEDYMFVTLLDETPVLQPMEKIRSVYPNVMHIERRIERKIVENNQEEKSRHQIDELSLFQSFYKEMKGTMLTEEKEKIFCEVLVEAKRGEQ